MIDLRSAEVAIIGGGQAGLAVSYHLTALGRSHVILEQGRTVESWRSKRWDSLRLIAPNWSLVLPGLAFQGDDADGFMSKDEVVERLVQYARSFGAPVREGVRVTSVDRDPGDTTFVLQLEDGELEAKTVVIATGALQRPRVPDYASMVPAGIVQLVPSEYRRPDALPPGRVLIVGSGETGCQISEELARAGRDVFLSGGRAWWAPRRYRGRDIAVWLRLVGWFERLASDLPAGAHAGKPNPQLTGASGGHDISPHSLARDGVTLLPRLGGIVDEIAYFEGDVGEMVAWGDRQALALLRAIDRVVDEQGLDVPSADLPDDLTVAQEAGRASLGHNHGSAPLKLELSSAGISTIIWASGYRPDLSWVRLPVSDSDGYPIQRRGTTPVTGLYVVGLDWLHTAKSGLFAGVGDDAGHIASLIAGPR